MTEAPAAPTVHDIVVPGRLCLFGEHSDWAGSHCRVNSSVRPGRTIVVGTDAGLYCRVQALVEPRLLFSSVNEHGEQLGTHELDLSRPRQLLEEAKAGGFWAYVAGTAYKMVVEHMVAGLRIDNYRTTLPFKKGLSSSAAVCVAVARGFNRAYGLQLSTRGEMECAYQGERLTPSLCGRMDQCGAFGRVPLLMTFEGEALECQQLRLGAPLHLVLVDLRAGKDTVQILAHLQAAFPEAVTPQEAALHDLLGATNERITSSAISLLEAGDARGLGALMREAQQEFDAKAAPLCPEHLASPVLHRVLSYQPIQQHVWGGKGVGSQGDGTAQFVCRSQNDQAAVCHILKRDLGMHCTRLTLQQTNDAHSPADAQAAMQRGSGVTS